MCMPAQQIVRLQQSEASHERGQVPVRYREPSTSQFDDFTIAEIDSPGRVNLLTNPALDPVSKMPEFKVCAVRISKAAEDRQATVLVYPIGGN